MKIKKWYRIFLIQWNADKGELSPVIPSSLDNKSNWYDTIEEAEEVLPFIIKESSKTYTILPIYESEF